MKSLTAQLHLVEEEIAAIYHRNCKGANDRARLKLLQAQQQQLTTARAKAHAQRKQGGDASWQHMPGKVR
jgi:hypothetical protein